MDGTSLADWLKPDSLRIARLTGFAGKLTAVLIALAVGAVFCLKYSMNPMVQFVVIGCFFLLMLMALATLMIYALRHPERVMLEGSEIIQIEQIRMKNGLPSKELLQHPLPGRVIARQHQEVGGQ